MTAAGPQETIDVATILDEAHRLAREAATRADVSVSQVTELAGLEAVEALINETWQNPTAEISLGLLRALSKSGNLVSGAYRGEELVGACVAFAGREERHYLHSHLAAVRLRQRTKGIGFALKLHQRAWALDRGITSVSWTFDPLVRRNARLNLARLGARPVEYLPDFYGTREDAFNVSVPTDRILVIWSLADQRTRLACARTTALVQADDLTRNGARTVLAAGSGDEPIATADHGEPTLLVGLPEDISALRRDRPDVAERWRQAVREFLGGALDRGRSVVGFTEQGHYVIDRGTVGPPTTRGIRG